jgi:hypothetical protein
MVSMKLRIFICVLFISLFVTGNLCAQKIQVKKDSATAYVESDGTIYSAVKSVIGYFKIDNTIQNSGHFVIGYLLPSGDILDDSTKLIGYIEKDGTVRNGDGAKLGQVLDDGTVIDNKNRTLVKAPEIKREWLAVVYFFFEE